MSKFTNLFRRKKEIELPIAHRRCLLDKLKSSNLNGSKYTSELTGKLVTNAGYTLNDIDYFIKILKPTKYQRIIQEIIDSLEKVKHE
jgi:hypothetical protein